MVLDLPRLIFINEEYGNLKLNHQRCSKKKRCSYTGKHLCQSLFFNKVAGLSPATLLKRRFWHRGFSVNFVKFLKTPFLQNTSGDCFLTMIMMIEINVT